MRALLLSLFLTFCASAWAGQAFLVLGSFVDEQTAREEGQRINASAGIEVLLQESIVNSKVHYRLLTGSMSESSDQASLKVQLQRSGVEEPWMLKFPVDVPFMETIFADLDFDSHLETAELAEIDTSLMSVTPEANANYVVAGSFQERAKGQALAGQLSDIPQAISVHEIQVFDAMFHRVLIGPVLNSEQAGVLSALKQKGVQGAWVLRSGAGSGAGSKATASTQIAKIPIQILAGNGESSIGEENAPASPAKPATFNSGNGSSISTQAKESSFNLATLKKKPTFWPDPRQKK